MSTDHRSMTRVQVKRLCVSIVVAGLGLMVLLFFDLISHKEAIAVVLEHGCAVLAERIAFGASEG